MNGNLPRCPRIVETIQKTQKIGNETASQSINQNQQTKHPSHFWAEEESLRVKTHSHYNGRNFDFFLTQRHTRLKKIQLVVIGMTDMTG